MYGNAPLEWSRATEQLESAAGMLTYWLATMRADGRPHIAGIGAKWVNERIWFTSGPSRQKSRNLATSANCAVSVALPGIDLTVNGTAVRVTDEATIARLAERYAADGWPAVAEGGSDSPVRRRRQAVRTRTTPITALGNQANAHRSTGYRESRIARRSMDR
jgi:hypothetical protein